MSPEAAALPGATNPGGPPLPVDLAAIAAVSAASKPLAPSPLDVLTLSQAAEYLSVPEEAVRAEAESGRLIGQKIGGEWRFLRECIVNWLRTPLYPTRPAAGLGAGYSDEDPEEFIAAIYRERKKSRGGA